jgi:hypothetical protein
VYDKSVKVVVLSCSAAQRRVEYRLPVPQAPPPPAATADVKVFDVQSSSRSSSIWVCTALTNHAAGNARVVVLLWTWCHQVAPPLSTRTCCCLAPLLLLAGVVVLGPTAEVQILAWLGSWHQGVAIKAPLIAWHLQSIVLCRACSHSNALLLQS